MKTFRALLLAAACWCLAIAAATAADPVTGRVSILWDKPQFIQLVPDLKLYPGQVIEVVSSGQVDVDHEFGENRRCKWFGLKCWHESWDRPTWLGADALDIELVLEEGTVTTAVSGTGHRLDIPLAAGNANFTRGVRLSGMLWKKGRQHPIHRGPCIGRPKHCSQGDLQLTFASVNSTARLDALESILSNQRIETMDVLALTSRDYIDPLLFDPAIAPEATIQRLSSIVTKAAGQFRDRISNKASGTAAHLHMKVIDLASYALKLSRVTEQDAARLRTLITESYLDRGEFARATNEAPKMMADADAAFQKSPGGENALIYARALKANAAAWREKGARNSSSDIRVSIALLDKATEMLWGYTDYPGVSQVMADTNVDAARMLNLLRTVAELKAAEDRLVAAICFQTHGEKGAGSTFDAWRSSASDAVVGNCQSVRKDTSGTPTANAGESR